MKGNKRFVWILTISLLTVLMTTLTGCNSNPASTASDGRDKVTSKPDSEAANSGKPTNKSADKSTDKSAGEGAGKDVSEAIVKVTALQGSQVFPLEVMDKQGIAAKYKLKIERKMMVGPQALYTAMQTPDFEVSFGGWSTIALMREQGHKLINVYPFLGYTNEILVTKDSPLKIYEDLKGKRIGLFGGPSAGTTVLFRMEGIQFFGFDPLKQAKIQYGAPPLLAGMLDRGDLDAILLLEPVSTQLLESGKYRSIGNIGGIWREKTGEDPLFLTTVMNQTWAEANPDVAKRFVAAFKESLDYMKSHEDVWPALAKSEGVKTTEGIDIIRKNFVSILYTDWNQGLIDQQYKSFAETKKLFPEIDGFPKEIPDGTFTLKFAP